MLTDITQDSHPYKSTVTQVVLNSLILVAREIDEPSPDLFPLSKGSRHKSLSPGEVTDARGHHGSNIFKCN